MYFISHSTKDEKSYSIESDSCDYKLPIVYILRKHGHSIYDKKHITNQPTMLVKYCKIENNKQNNTWYSYVLSSSEYESALNGEFIIPSSELWKITDYKRTDAGLHLFDYDDTEFNDIEINTYIIMYFHVV